MSLLAATLFGTPAMAAIFAPRAFIQRLLDFEAALARAEAAAGLITAEAAGAIAEACRADRFDLEALAHDGAAAATPVVPLLRALEAQLPPEARAVLHWGATSQDALDTAAVLQVREGLDLLESGLRAVGERCAALIGEHRRTVMPGRTLLQHAVPVTFGLKAARWLALVVRQVQRLREVRPRVLVLQFGGAAGTLAALGEAGLRVAERLAQELQLGLPDLPWHAERDRIGEVAAWLALTAAGMGKVATDLVLLSQTEVGEAATAGGEAGRSSAMPQKRNPVEAVAALACARLAVGDAATVLAAGVGEHERAAGAWQAEWEALPALFRHTAGAVEWVRRALVGLQVDAERMRANLALAGGTIMAEALLAALQPHLGREAARRVVERLVARAGEGGDLRRAAATDPEVAALLPAGRLETVLDPLASLGSTEVFIDRALAAWQALGP